jgi:hypothetical protein
VVTYHHHVEMLRSETAAVMPVIVRTRKPQLKC